MTDKQRVRDILPIEDCPSRLDEFGPIFIIGCPRSGTTFLSRCLSADEDIEAFDGLLTSPRLLHFMASKHDHPNNEIILLSMRDLFWQSFWRRRFFRIERMSQFIQRNTSVWSLLHRGQFGSALFLYRDLFLSLICVGLAEHFPNSKFLHVIRDGRDCADSMERRYPHSLSDRVLKSEELALNKVSEIGVWRLYDDFVIPWWVNVGDECKFIEFSQYERCVWLWKEMTQTARHLKGLNLESRYLEIRYEDLVESPCAVMEIIMRFIGRPINSRVRQRVRKAHNTSTGIGLTRQPRENIIKANIIAGELLEELGYRL